MAVADMHINRLDPVGGAVVALIFDPQYQPRPASTRSSHHDQFDIVVLVETKEDATRFAGVWNYAIERVGDPRMDGHRLPRVEADLERVVLRIDSTLVGTERCV